MPVSQASPDDSSQERAIASYRELIEMMREQDWITEQHLRILEDNWVTDAELAEIEETYSSCVAEHFPGATVEFPSPTSSRTTFATPEQQELAYESANPCTGLMGLIRPLHYNMRANPDNLPMTVFVRNCIEEQNSDLAASLTDNQLDEAMRSDALSSYDPVIQSCVKEVTQVN